MFIFSPTIRVERDFPRYLKKKGSSMHSARTIQTDAESRARGNNSDLKTVFDVY